jgi:hypothetical protein
MVGGLKMIDLYFFNQIGLRVTPIKDKDDFIGEPMSQSQILFKETKKKKQMRCTAHRAMLLKVSNQHILRPYILRPYIYIYIYNILLKVDAVQVVTAMIFKDSNWSRFDQVEDTPIVLDSFSS